MARKLRLTSDEIQRAFEDSETQRQFPPILSPDQFANLIGISTKTVYFWIAQGRLKGAVTKAGKHRFIWRNRAIEILFNPNSKEQNYDDN